MKVVRMLAIFAITTLGITETVSAQVNRKMHYSEDGRTIHITVESNSSKEQIWEKISELSKDDQEMIIYLLTSEGIKQLDYLNTAPDDLLADSHH